jgi:hypothetical protein
VREKRVDKMENKTIQRITSQEKAKEMIEIKTKKDQDLVLFYHYETVKDELLDEYLKNLR